MTWVQDNNGAGIAGKKKATAEGAKQQWM